VIDHEVSIFITEPGSSELRSTVFVSAYFGHNVDFGI
jgi:hypothetical protein